MKSFVLKEPGIVAWHDSPEPELCRNGAILKPIAVSTCSSDVHTVFGNGSRKMPNLILGHECIAEILEVDDSVKDFKKGDRVAVPSITPNWRDLAIQDGNYKHASAPFSGHQLGRSFPGAFSEKFLIPDADTTLAKIPDEISDKQALMSVDVMTTGLTGAENAEIKLGDTVCVLGIGPIGLMAIAGAVHLGAGRVIAVGSRKKCVELAKYYGATDIVNYRDSDIVETILRLTDNIGVDGTIIAGGSTDVISQAFDITRYGIGTISNVNYFGGTGYLPVPIFSAGRGMCGKTLHMELANGGRRRIERMFDLIRFNRINPDSLVTHVLYGFDQIEKALHMMKEKAADTVKVMVYTEL